MAIPKDFGFGPEEQMMRDQARKFLKDNLPTDKLRVLVARDHEVSYESDVQPAPWDEGLWRQAVELGWTTLAVPEAAGGAGMGWTAVAALAEESGRAALPSPLLPTLVATAVLRAAAERDGDAAAGAWLERIAGGESMTLAALPGEGGYEPSGAGVCARATESGFVLQGEAAYVQDARKVNALLVAAEAPAGTVLVCVPVNAPGVEVVPDQIVDLTRDQARVKFCDVEVDADGVVCGAANGADALAAAMPAVRTIIAADMCGAAEWQLQTTAEYARTRKQFEHEIGFFQAVKHPIVNMMVDLDRARSLVFAAAAALDHEPESAERLSRMAKAAASDAGAFCSDRSVQLHGGIGFTWECDVHLYFKRQKHSQFLWGDGTHQRACLAAAW
jgi:alkylation response protein AidB-like acyl-CoA dehydrogenase